MTGCWYCLDPGWANLDCPICLQQTQTRLAAAHLPPLSCQPEPRRLTRRVVARCSARRRP